MSDWIDELGEDVEHRKKTQPAEDAFQLSGAELIRQKKKELWESLMQVINRDVEKFRVKFAGRRMVEMTVATEPRFRLHKTPFPIVMMDAEMSLNGASIEVTYTRTLQHSAPMERSQETLEISLDKKGNFVFTHNGRSLANLDSVSRFLLEPVFRVD